MAINLASKFSPKVDEAITIGSYTGKHLNTDYDFEGVDTVKIYSVATTKLRNYRRAGANRFGIPNDLQDVVQTMQLKQDVAFTTVIDKGDNSEQMMIKNSAKALKRQTEEVMIPYIDKYRFAIMCEEAKYGDATALTKSNVYEKFLAGTTHLMTNGIGAGVTAYIAPTAYALLKQDGSFIKSGDMSQKLLVTGQVGEVDGVAIVPVGGNRLPSGVDYILEKARIMVSPTKLRDYRVQKDPLGYSGDVIEGRLIFDAFILDKKKVGLYVQGNRVADMVMEVEAGASAGTTNIIGMSVDVYRDEKVYYATGSSAKTLPAIGSEYSKVASTFPTEMVLDNHADEDLYATVSATAGNVVTFVVVDRNGNIRQGGTFTAV